MYSIIHSACRRGVNSIGTLLFVSVMMASLGGFAQNAPTISNIGPQVTQEDTAIGSLAFTLDDGDGGTSVSSVSVTSGDTSIVANSGLQITGSGGSRNLEITPVEDAFGTVIITVTVTDVDGSASDDFELTVSAVNDAPTFPVAIPDQETNQDTDIDVAFTVDDIDDANSGLTALATSSDQSIVADGDITVLPASPTDGNRTLRITPKAGKTGNVTITVTVDDGSGDFSPLPSQQFDLKVNAPPVVSVADRTTNEDIDLYYTFTISDPDDDDSLLNISVDSDDTNGNVIKSLAFTDDVGPSVTLEIILVGNANTDDFSKPNITVTATDDFGFSTNETFELTVNAINDAPTITGIVPTQINDDANALLFGALTINDIENDVVTLTVSIDETDTTLGVLSTPGSPSGTVVSASESSITLSGSPANVTTALQSLPIIPTANSTPVGDLTNFSLILALQDSPGLNSPNNGTRTTQILSVNDAPTIAVSVAPTSIDDTDSAQPFTVSIEDPDIGQTHTLTVSISDSTYGDFETPNPSIGGTISEIESAVRNLRFVANEDSVSGSEDVDCTFSVSDGLATGSETQTFTINGVNDTPDIAGTSTELLRVDDDETIAPFTSVILSDPDAADNLEVVLSMEPAGAGEFRDASNNPVTTFTDTQANATSKIQQIVFVPDEPTGDSQTVTLIIEVTDPQDADREDRLTQVVVTKVNSAPEIVGIPTEQPQLITPAASVSPFGGFSVDDDEDSEVTVIVRLDNPEKGFFDLDPLVDLFSETGPGTYSMTGSEAQVSSELAGLRYVVSESFQFPVNEPGGVTFELSALDEDFVSSVYTHSILLQEEPRTFLVTTTDDNLSPGSLRFAVQNAGNNDFITFALPTYPAVIRLSHSDGELALEKNLNLRGPGANNLTISGDFEGDNVPDMRPFVVSGIVSIEGLRIANGTERFGGAISVTETGRLTLKQCVIANSVATLWGGAIDVNGGELTVIESAFVNNSVSASQGLGGGAVSLFTDQEASFVNVTFSGNKQPAAGGFGGAALYVENRSPETELLVRVDHATFSGNEDAADQGNSIHSNVFGSRVAVSNSILANGVGRNLQVKGAGEIDSLGGNISDDSSRTTLTRFGVPKAIILLDQTTDLVDTDPLLTGLDTTLGATPVFGLRNGSPAIGKATSAAAYLDQHGSIRDDDPDSGAYEPGLSPRVVINEIQAKRELDLSGNPIVEEFIEFYVPRDAAPINLLGYSIWIDGAPWSLFESTLPVQPGFGVIVAKTDIGSGSIAASGESTDEIFGVATSDGLDLRGSVELRGPGPNRSIAASADYVDVFVDPTNAGLSNLSLPQDSITLAPQFMGSALVPHSIVLAPPGAVDLFKGGSTESPGADSGGTLFGADNAKPFAKEDSFVVNEDELSTLEVLLNDSDADGTDQIFVVHLSPSDGTTGSDDSITTGAGADADVEPKGTPLRGLALTYDPRSDTSLQGLPEGAEIEDSFYYQIADVGLSAIVSYEEDPINSRVVVTSPAHRLQTGDAVTISGSDVADYNGQYAAIERVDSDRFSIDATFVGPAVIQGVWKADDTREPGMTEEAQVFITVLGANDFPMPSPDLVATDEETILRVMGDSTLVGSSTQFDTDDDYLVAPVIYSGGSLLANDTDPDTGETSSLGIVGVLGAVTPISNFSGAVGETPVTVSSTGHGLTDGETILISGYGGHPSYNGFQTVTVVDDDSFTLPVEFVDNNVAKGEWGILNDDNRLETTTQYGAIARVELRADPIETSVVYDPTGSEEINALGVTPSGVPETLPTPDVFYYAIQDIHGATSFTSISVDVSGVNDLPEPNNDPASLAVLEGFTNGGTLEDLIASIAPEFVIPSQFGNSGLYDLGIQSPANPGAILTLADVWTTLEDRVLTIISDDLLENDSDVDTNDHLTVIDVLGSPSKPLVGLSREGATVTLAGDLSSITYDPTLSASLNSLSREEALIDTFEITVSDNSGEGPGNVNALVAVVVIGANDSPTALDDAVSTGADQILIFDLANLLLNDSDPDVNGWAPDDMLNFFDTSTLVSSIPGVVTSLTSDTLTYNPVASPTYIGLALGQTAVDSLPYTVTDGSQIFANDDAFKVEAPFNAVPVGGAPILNFTLDVLANDRNLVGFSDILTIVDVGTPNRQGTVAISSDGLNVVYAPQDNFVGNEVFTYTVQDEFGNSDRGVVVVRVTVDILNGSLQANNDDFNVALGQSSSLNVLANDDTIPEDGSNLSITEITAAPTYGTAEIVDNEVVFTADSFPTATHPIASILASADLITTGTPHGLSVEDQVEFVEIISASGPAELNEAKTYFVLATGLTATEFQISASMGGAPVDFSSDLASGLLELRIRAVRDTFEYAISGGGVAISCATVNLYVTDGAETLNVRDDAFSVPVDSRDNVLDVLANDNILPGSVEALSIVNAPSGPSHGTIEIDETSSVLIYDPDPGFVGVDSLTYEISDGVGGTGTGTVTISIGRLSTSPDFFVVELGSGARELDVLANDRVFPEAPGSISLKSVNPLSSAIGSIDLNGDQSALVFTPSTTSTGEATFTYQIIDGGTASARSTSGEVTVVVIDQGLKANSDFFSVLVDSEANELAVLDNDAAFPTSSRVLSIVGIGVGLSAPNRGGVVEISENGKTLFYTPAPGFVGEESFTYSVTDSLDVDVVKVVTRVTSGSLEANPDNYTVFFEGDPAGVFSLPVLDNDRLLPDTGELISITGVGIDDSNATNAPDRAGFVSISEDRDELVYQPRDTDGPFPYTERFTYEISDGKERRADAAIEIVVTQRTGEREVETNDDRFTVESGSANNPLAVLENDGVLPGNAESWAITGLTSPDHGGIAIVSGSNILYTPDGEFVGTETFSYTISDGLGGLGSATVSVRVGDLPLCPDVFAVLNGSSDNVLDVLANDGTLPQDGSGFNLVSASGASTSGSVVVSSGVVLYTPDSSGQTLPYVETFEYEVQNDSGESIFGSAQVTVYEPGLDRDLASLNITVVGVNEVPAIDIVPSSTTSYGFDPFVPFPDIEIVDPDDSGNELLTVIITIDNPGLGAFSATSGFVESPIGAYTLLGVNATTAQGAIRGLEFLPDPTSVEWSECDSALITIEIIDPHGGIASATSTIDVCNIGQRFGDNWVFGDGCVLSWDLMRNLTFGSDVDFNNDGGGASWSNPATGEWLVYTDGRRVYNVVTGGVVSGTDGELSDRSNGGSGDDDDGNSSSGFDTIVPAMIVPKPGGDPAVNLFVFATGRSDQDIYLTEIDLSQGPNGGVVGSVGSRLSGTRNSDEGWTLLPHANDSDYWLVLGDGDAFHIGASGVISETRNSDISSNNGRIRYSVDGTRIATGRSNSDVEIYDFDPATGQIGSSSIELDVDDVYFEFSHDGSKFYVNDRSSDRLYQFDLSADPGPGASSSSRRNAVRATRVTLHNFNSSDYVGDLTLAPDGQIYVVGNSGNPEKLHVIRNPDAAGVAADFERNALNLPNGCNLQLGLYNGIRVDDDFLAPDTSTVIVVNALTEPSGGDRLNPTVRLTIAEGASASSFGFSVQAQAGVYNLYRSRDLKSWTNLGEVTFFHDGQVYGIDDDSVASNASVFYRVAPASTIAEK